MITGVVVSGLVAVMTETTPANSRRAKRRFDRTASVILPLATAIQKDG